MDTVFIINPKSGKKRTLETGDIIRNYLEDNSIDAEIVLTLRSGHATELVREYLKKGVKKIIAVGGDGTVNEVAKAMIGTNAALGIIPRGSGNGLARHMKIPLKTEKALKVIEKNTIVSIDYGLINDIPFFCTSGIGFDAYIGHLFATSIKRGFSSYLKIGLSEFFRYKPSIYSLLIDEELIERKAFLITFANASQYGNNAFIAPQANISDGLLNVVILKSFPLIMSPFITIRLFLKNIHKSKYIETFTCKEVKVSNGNTYSIHFDGEPSQVKSPVHINIISNSLNVLV